jgi:predicted phage terminase large subunit-like protein
LASLPTCRLTTKQLQALDLLGGPQRHTMLYGGSRSGKTWLLVRCLVARALLAPGTRHAIVRFRFNHVRASVWLDTFPKVMATNWPDVPYKDNLRDGLVSLKGGSEIWFAGLDDKERSEKVLGQEYLTIYLNECSQIPYSSVLVFRTRLAQTHGKLAQRAYYDCNPPGTGHWTHREFVEGRDPVSKARLANPAAFAALNVNPVDNLENLDPAYLAELEAMPERQRRRFYDGKFTDDVEGALWPLDAIERCRCAEADVPRLERVVIGVDPSGARGEDDKKSDEIGIVAGGRGVDRRGYVLGDYSLRAAPEAWARAAIAAYDKHDADAIVAEVNYGGDMVRAVIQGVARSMGREVPVRLVHASRGKHVRAEPVSALYEERQDRVRHAGRFVELEDQMMGFTTAGYVGDRSPDRADACLAAGTVVATQIGPLPVELVRAGDRVWTREGLRPVTWSGMTRQQADLIRLQLSDGSELVGTAEHPVYTKKNGFVPLDALVCGDILLSGDDFAGEPWPWTNHWNSSWTGEFIAATRTASSAHIGSTTPVRLARGFAFITETFTRRSTVQSRPDGMSITRTRTRSTTIRTITNACRRLSTLRGTLTSTLSILARTTMLSLPLPSGIGPLKAGLGIASMAGGPGKGESRLALAGASSAASQSSATTKATGNAGFVRSDATDARPTAKADMFAWSSVPSAHLRSLRTNTPTGQQPVRGFVAGDSAQGATGLAEKTRNALSVAATFLGVLTGKRTRPAPVSVVGKCVVGAGPVYNLHVDGRNEFFASGVLVHNCIWMLTDLMLGYQDTAGIAAPVQVAASAGLGRHERAAVPGSAGSGGVVALG